MAADSVPCKITRAAQEAESRRLFEESAWLYSFCREHLFCNHTDQIVEALFPDNAAEKMSILEVGCGPGFYARRLAERFPNLQATGIDRSARLIAEARRLALSAALTNCHFRECEVESLSGSLFAVDAVISSRLLLVVHDREPVIREIFRVLKPGGRLFLAEPTSSFKTKLPLSAMRLAASFMRGPARKSFPLTAKVMDSDSFEKLVRSQPWAEIALHRHGDYQWAVCRKSCDIACSSLGEQRVDQGVVASRPRASAE